MGKYKELVKLIDTRKTSNEEFIPEFKDLFINNFAKYLECKEHRIRIDANDGIIRGDKFSCDFEITLTIGKTDFKYPKPIRFDRLLSAPGFTVIFHKAIQDKEPLMEIEYGLDHKLFDEIFKGFEEEICGAPSPRKMFQSTQPKSRR